MSTYQSVELDRIFILELEPGEDILESVAEIVREKEIRSAVFLAGAGSVDNCRSHFAAKDETGHYMDYPLEWRDTPFQISGVGGFIEKGRAHLHAVIGNENESWTVHLHEGCTCMSAFRLAIAELRP